VKKNVHENGIPPWEREDEIKETSTSISLISPVKAVPKKGKEDLWLPKFGRVFVNGSRAESRKEALTEILEERNMPKEQAQNNKPDLYQLVQQQQEKTDNMPIKEHRDIVRQRLKRAIGAKK